ncbi:probable G-protein coupled receptor 139 [Rhincodon typus]|uniref:probable G-protein coupled receptor 139 n=1 Tax=Rhincodon typus TaxID=259920 RepID=UPI0020309272|nr:probable G-protein coupled receptor 139 [Rhincodon typus]
MRDQSETVDDYRRRKASPHTGTVETESIAILHCQVTDRGCSVVSYCSHQAPNLLVIVILARGRCGLSKCFTYYLEAIAVFDFLVIISVILNRIGRIYFRYNVLSTTPVCSLIAVLVHSTQDGSVWLTVAFTIDRFVAICCQNLKTRYCTEKTASLVIGTVCILNCIKNVPLYFIYRPLYTIRGVPWFCNIKSTYYTFPVWQAYDMLDPILIPIFPFVLIFLLNALTIKHILGANRSRQRLRGVENRQDPEIMNHKRPIVLLFAISLSFFLLWATQVGRFLYVRVRGAGYFNNQNFKDPQYIISETTNMLQLLSSCNNFFIYAVSQNKFREELKVVMKYPFIIHKSVFKR